MKLAFAQKSVAARSFRCATLAGPAVFGPYRVAEAETDSAGAATSQNLPVGQDHHTGTAAGVAHG